MLETAAVQSVLEDDFSLLLVVSRAKHKNLEGIVSLLR